MAANESVAWHPEHVKHGRFGDWLKNNVDWALSRERYWGTPLPIWRCPNGHTHVIGSFAELAELAGRQLPDHHRPYVDELEFPCATEGCPAVMGRVPEVIDVWFDSGAMPFAQHHYPFENEQQLELGFPADFICEAQDQTRGWFYSLLAISTLLGRGAPYRNVVCLGIIVDAEGQKMSKSRGQRRRPVADPRRIRRRRVPLVLPDLETALGRLPVLGRGDRRRRAAVPQAALVDLLLLRPIRGRRATSSRTPGRRGDRPRPLDHLADRGDRRARRGAARGLRRDGRGPGDRGARGGALELVRAPLAAPVLGRRPGGLPDIAHVLVASPSCSPPSARSSPTRSTTTSTGARERAPVRLPRGSQIGERDEALERVDAARTRDGPARARRARKSEDQGSPAARRGGRCRRRRRAQRDRTARNVVRDELNVRKPALRRRSRRARDLRGKAELPHARSALREPDAARRRGRPGARPAHCR